jgi:hypothetical protein
MMLTSFVVIFLSVFSMLEDSSCFFGLERDVSSFLFVCICFELEFGGL